MTNYELFAGGDLTGIHLALGEGSVDAIGMALSKGSLAFSDGTALNTNTVGSSAVDMIFNKNGVANEIHLTSGGEVAGLRMATSPSPSSTGTLSTVLWNGLSFADTVLNAVTSFKLSELLLSVGVVGSKLFSKLTNSYLSITDEVLKKSSTLSNSSLAFGDNGKSCTLDKSQLATDTTAFSISNTGTMSLSATEIKLSNIAFDSLSNTAGSFTNQFVRIKSGSTYYKIPLRLD
jgi:hypothetical protein